MLPFEHTSYTGGHSKKALRCPSKKATLAACDYDIGSIEIVTVYDISCWNERDASGMIHRSRGQIHPPWRGQRRSRVHTGLQMSRSRQRLVTSSCPHIPEVTEATNKAHTGEAYARNLASRNAEFLAEYDRHAPLAERISNTVDCSTTKSPAARPISMRS